ncbi:MAG: type II toxin-antitoxin system RelE/ParE family toxin [Bacteroides sp.]|nr:type II toxin-antitoxin system RelE/ParE family toxin [Bacteroides sp.]
MRGLKVVLMDEASSFIRSLPEKAQKKVTYNLLRVEGGEISQDLFKKLEHTPIWEFRTLFDGRCYRLFAFWDTESETIVIATHGIIKKTQKTPRKEIAKAEELRRRYFADKER